ncbi:MAG: DUF4160 domain-containing protein [Calditrichaceae bacterium]|nr:DUF4160 domain-containing protein [Calditrichaceae bacterium]MBN2707874.1 DUF4160 domain-containing protein [Calditrichaceae bacterium]RQV94244.1 MAG: DUF4160 domain-containing protein [Calditrichota bacterium]
MIIDDLVEKKINESSSLNELVFILDKLLRYNSVWEDGTLYSIRQLVAYVDGLKVEIFHNEHPPPHFHVSTSDFKATFTIETCDLIEGTIGKRERKIIEWWHKKSCKKLIDIWNHTRPSDCKVGKIIV